LLKIPTDSLPDEARLEISTKNIFGTYHRNDGLVNHDIGAEASVEIPIKNAEPEGDFDKVDIEDAEVIEESDGDYVLEPEITLYDDFLQGNPANCEEAVYDIKIEYEEEDDYWREITTLETNIEFDGYEVYYNDDNRVEIPADGGQGDVNVRVTLTAHDEYGGWEESVEESFEWEYKPELTIDIEGEGSTEPEEGWYFDRWTGTDETGEEITITMDDDKEITVYFKEYVVLTIDVDGEGKVEINPEREEYEEGTEVTLTAVPDEGWYFDEWTGDVTGVNETEKMITITIDDDKEITVYFKEYVALTIDVEGEGKVEINPEWEEYKGGTEVTLEAIPEDDWDFKEWTGDHEGTEAEITVTLDEDKTITALFEEDEEVTTGGWPLAGLVLAVIALIVLLWRGILRDGKISDEPSDEDSEGKEGAEDEW